MKSTLAVLSGLLFLSTLLVGCSPKSSPYPAEIPAAAFSTPATSAPTSPSPTIPLAPTTSTQASSPIPTTVPSAIDRLFAMGLSVTDFPPGWFELARQTGGALATGLPNAVDLQAKVHILFANEQPRTNDAVSIFNDVLQCYNIAQAQGQIGRDDLAGASGTPLAAGDEGYSYIRTETRTRMVNGAPTSFTVTLSINLKARKGVYATQIACYTSSPTGLTPTHLELARNLLMVAVNRLP